MKTLITGGAGFIGSYIADALIEQGHEVRVLDNLASATAAGTTPCWRHARYVELIRGDIRDLPTVEKAVRGTEVVFHQAALPSVQRSILDPASCHDVNVTGTLNVLLASRDGGARRVVFASSSSVYGDTVELPKREGMTPHPLSPYAAAKLTGEHYLRLFWEHYGLETVALRYFNVFGPRQSPRSEYAAVIPRFVTAVLEGEQPVIYGDGEQTRDFTPVENVVDANLKAAAAEAAPGNVYNVGCGTRMSLNQLVRHLAYLAGRDVRPQYLPGKQGDVRDSLACIASARRDLGFEPVLSTEDGLATMVEAARVRRAA